MKQFLFAFATLLLAAMFSCTDPLTVGGDLLEEDRAGVGQTMDIAFTTRVVEDTLQVFNLNQDANLPLFSFGSLNDEVFGNWKNSVYVNALLSRERFTDLAIRPPFAFSEMAQVDSVVLIMQIDTASGFYGPGRSFDIAAGLTMDRIRKDQDYFSNLDLGETTGDLNVNTSVTLVPAATQLYDTTYSNGDTLTLPHLRVLLNDAFTAEVNSRDEFTWNSDSTLASLIPGLYLEPTDETNSLVTIRPRFGAANSLLDDGFYYFYKDSTASRNERIFTNRLSLWLPRYERDYTGSRVGDLLANDVSNEEVAVTGQAGVMTEITFPDVSELEGKVINQAELKFFRKVIEDYSYETYGTPERVALFFRNEAGVLVPITDFGFLTTGANRGGTTLNVSAGGQERMDDNGDFFYAPRLSLYLQNMVEGLAPNTIYLRTISTSSDPSRVILHGPGAAEKAASLTVTFTERGN